METLRLSFLADRSAPMYPGGYEYHLLTLARELAKSHEVRVYTSLDVPERTVNGVHFVKIAPRLEYVGRKGRHGLLSSALFGLSASLTTPNLRGVDFLDVQGIPYSHVPLLRLRRDFASLRWGLTVWEAWSEAGDIAHSLGYGTYLSYRAAFRLAISGDQLLIVGSKQTRNVLQSRFRIPFSRLAVVSPRIDITKYAPLGSRERDVDVVYIGRLAPYKRVADLVLALARLSSESGGPCASIAGDGPQANMLGQLVRQLNLSGRVTLLGRISDSAKVELLQRAKLFVLPSEREGFSIATLEAMACGTVPVVAVPTDPGAYGVADLVEGTAAGQPYACGSIEELAHVIAEILSAPDELERASKAAVSVARNYDVTSLAPAYVKAIGLG